VRDFKLVLFRVLEDRLLLVRNGLLLPKRGYLVDVTKPVLAKPTDDWHQSEYAKPSRTYVQIGESFVDFGLEECWTSVAIPPPRNSYSQSPTYERRPDGRLALKLKSVGWHYRGRTTWADGKHQRVERCLNDFIVAVITVAERNRIKRVEEKREEAVRAERERRRAEEEARRKHEAALVSDLESRLANWTKAAQILSLLEEARAAATIKRFEVEVKSGWIEPLNIYSAVTLASGNRKSAVVRDATLPVMEHERELVRRFAPVHEAQKTKYEIAEAELKLARDHAAKAEPDKKAALVEEAERLANELAGKRRPVSPRLLAEDITPESLATLLRDQGGRIGVLSAEGGIFDLMAGRYSEGIPNLEVFLKAHSGDPFYVDRVNRPPEHVASPALTLGLAVQPEVLRGLARKKAFRGRGLLARFFYSSALGTRSWQRAGRESGPAASLPSATTWSTRRASSSSTRRRRSICAKYTASTSSGAP
jgi:hypothetical protein